MSSSSPIGFDLRNLWEKQEAIHNARDSGLIYFNGYYALTREKCKDLVGGSGSSPYDFASWFTRLTTWKVPLVQLVFLFPRPPLDLSSEIFVLVHLVGNPINTIWSLIIKISRCQAAVIEWQSRLSTINSNLQQVQERQWKALALLTDAYDEMGSWESSGRLIVALLEADREKSEIWKVIYHASDALAADRATKYLPALVALIAFFVVMGVAVARTAAAIGTPEFNESIFIGVEMHGIAFTSLYFWIIPAVLLGSFIGVSQTEVRTPSILDRFQQDLDRHFKDEVAKGSIKLDVAEPSLKDLKSCGEGQESRFYRGGIYSWMPFDWLYRQTRSSKAPDEGFSPSPPGKGHKFINFMLLPFLIVFTPTLFSASASGRIPPDNFNCRVGSEIAFFIAWLSSAALDVPLRRYFNLEDIATATKLFRWAFCKDLFFALGTTGWLMATVIGALNRCDCWIGPHDELILPKRSDINNILIQRLHSLYPALIFSAMTLELIVPPIWIWLYYRDALKVFVQRDDGKSNFESYTRLWAQIKGLRNKVPQSNTTNSTQTSGTLAANGTNQIAGPSNTASYPLNRIQVPANDENSERSSRSASPQTIPSPTSAIDHSAAATANNANSDDETRRRITPNDRISTVRYLHDDNAQRLKNTQFNFDR